MKRYQAIAMFLNNEDKLDKLLESAPSGAGFDQGTMLSPYSTRNHLIFETAFHHMNNNGYYIYWTEHKVIVTPDLVFGFDLRVTGRDKRGIKEYIEEVFYEWLSEEVEG